MSIMQRWKKLKSVHKSLSLSIGSFEHLIGMGNIMLTGKVLFVTQKFIKDIKEYFLFVEKMKNVLQ